MQIEIIKRWLSFFMTLFSFFSQVAAPPLDTEVTQEATTEVIEETTEVIEETTTEEIEETTTEIIKEVYVTPSGKKYHLSLACAGKNGFSISIGEAIARGYTPCKKCVQETETEAETTTILATLEETTQFINEERVGLVSKMLYCEAGSTSYQCRRYTCSAIVNLIESRGGNYGLLDNANMFSPAPYYRNYAIRQYCYDMAKEVMYGDLRVPNVKYFRTNHYHYFGEPLTEIDGVYFSTD